MRKHDTATVSVKMPYNLEAEKIVIGGMASSSDLVADVSLILRDDDFYDSKHQIIYRAIIDLWAAKQPTDLVAIGEQINKSGSRQLLDAGGAPYLISLADYSQFRPLDAMHHVKAVKEKATLRKLIYLANEVYRAAIEGKESPEDILAEAETKFASMSADTVVTKSPMIGEVLSNVMNEISQRGNVTTDGIVSGFGEIDMDVGSMRPSNLILLAARPSVGKSSMAMQIAERTAEGGRLVFFVTLEMSQGELGERMLAGHARVDSRLLKNASFTPDDMSRLIGSYEHLSKLPIRMIDCPGAKLSTVLSEIRRQSMREPPALVVIDYLQLIEADHRSGSKHGDVSQVSKALKNLARELKIPVLALSQLSRGVEGRDNPEPRLSDLRESGSLEEDADAVIFLWKKDERKYPDEGVTGFKWAKNRCGPVATIDIRFDSRTTRFVEINKFVTNPSDFQL